MTKIRLLDFALILCAISSFAQISYAETSPGDLLCNYLSDQAAKASEGPVETSTLSSFAGGELYQSQVLALNAKLTFEQFQKRAKEQNLVVPDGYKRTYLNLYTIKYCGSAKTEAGVGDDKNKSMSNGQLRSFTKKPNVEQHSGYYKEAKAAK